MAILLTSLMSVIIKGQGITLGGIPTLMLYAPMFFISPLLCKKWDEYKAKRTASNPHQNEPDQVTAVNKKTHPGVLDWSKESKAKRLFCKQCGSELPEGSAFCNKCGTRVEPPAAHSEPPIYIDSLLEVNDKHLGKYVQLVGEYAWFVRQKDPLKCELCQFTLRGSIEIAIELTEPLPDYIVNSHKKEVKTIIFRGILSQTEEPYRKFVLKSAEYQGYWRDNNGTVRCLGNSCGHICSMDCPIYLNKLGKGKYDEYNRDEAIRLFKRSVFLAPYYALPWRNLGYTYLGMSQYNDAYEAFFNADKLAPNEEKAMYGHILSLAKIGRLKDAQDLLAKYRKLFPNKDCTILVNIITDNLSKLRPKPPITDAEYADLYTNKGWDEFWKIVLEEKEHSFATQQCDYTGDRFRKRSVLLKSEVRTIIDGKGEELLRMRNTLIRDNVKNADTMLMFDVIDNYVRNYIRF